MPLRFLECKLNVLLLQELLCNRIRKSIFTSFCHGDRFNGRVESTTTFTTFHAVTVRWLPPRGGLGQKRTRHHYSTLYSVPRGSFYTLFLAKCSIEGDH